MYYQSRVLAVSQPEESYFLVWQCDTKTKFTLFYHHHLLSKEVTQNHQKKGKLLEMALS